MTPAWHPHDFFGLFFCCIFGTACCSPKNDIVWPWDSELEALGFHWVPLWDVFFATSSDRVIFWESCSRAGESSQNKVLGSSELHKTLIKSDLAGGPVLGHTFFEQRCQHGWPLMIFYRFWGPPGEPTGGPTNHVFQFWKHCWDQMAPIPTQGPPKGPQGPKKSPPGSPRPQKITPPHRLSSVLCGVLTSFVKLFLHEIPCHTSSVYIPSPSSAASL